jgi:hypothetical protein
VPEPVSNITALNATGLVVNIGNATLKNLMANITASKFPVVLCPPKAPLYNGSKCLACPNGTYYLIKNLSCYTPGFVTNITELNMTNTYYNIGNATLTALNASIAASLYPVQSCPSHTPYFNGSVCMACPNGTYYLLGKNNLISLNETCMKPVFVTNLTAVANASYGVGNYSLYNVSSRQTVLAATQKIISCPFSAPLALTNGSCSPCNLSTHYVDLKRLTCNKSVLVSDFAVLKKSRVIQAGAANMTMFMKSQLKTTNGTPPAYCPASKPLYNGRVCIACNATQYYNLVGLTCYNPKNATNVTALALGHHYVHIQNYTLLNIERMINASKMPLNACPSSAPLFNGSQCIACNSSTYYDLKNLSCYTPHLASNVTALKMTNRSVSIGVYSLTNMAINISSSVYPLQPCPSKTPLFNGSQCIACNSSAYYDLRSLKCIMARQVSNVTALNATNKTIALGQYNLTALQMQIKALVVPYKPCPASAPLFNGSQCVACSPHQYYLL